jgi:tetratricopeptide (TPR) repeat protein
MVKLQLATAYGTVGRLADASGLATALAESYPGNLSVLVILGECMAQQGSVTASVEAFTAAITGIDGSDPGDVERRDDLRLRIAALHLAHRKGAAAETVLRDLELPDRPEALEVRARVALAVGRPREARQLAEKLPAGARGAATLLEGEALAREGRAVKAEASFAQAIAALGNPARERVAAIWRDVSQPQRAERLLRDWVKLAPDDAQARFALGRQLERHGSFGEAEGELRRTIELDPSNAQALNYLGYSLADRNQKLDDALRYVQRALELDAWNGAYHDSLGWVYYRMGQLEKAREPLERAAREYPFDATVLEHLGDLYDKLGESESAERAWRRALEAEPDDPATLRTKLARPKGHESGGAPGGI